MSHKKQLIFRLIFTFLSIFTVGFIFFNSMMNAHRSSEMSGQFIAFLNSILKSLKIDVVLDSFFVRKAAHFSEYTALGVILSVTVFLYVKKRLRTLLTTLPIGLVVAVCDEIIQMFSAGRSCEVRDMLIDFSGVLFGALIVQLVLYIITVRRRKLLKKEGNEIE